jgi:nitrogen fixation/metabolism regulation signal transduction histidine kinase
MSNDSIKEEKSMKIGTKMLLSYLLIVALFASIGTAMTITTMKMSELQDNALKQVEIENYAVVYQKGIDLQRISFLEGQLLDVTNAQADQVTAGALIAATETYLLENIPQGTELYAEFKKSYDLMHDVINPADAIVDDIIINQLTDRYEEVPAQYMIIQEGYTKVSESMTNFQVLALEEVEAATNQAKEYANFSVLLSAVGITTIAAVSIIMAIVMGKRITNPVKKLTDIAGKVSMGELEHEVKIDSKDEIGDLGEAFQRMINAFKMSNAMNSMTEEEQA